MKTKILYMFMLLALPLSMTWGSAVASASYNLTPTAEPPVIPTSVREPEAVPPVIQTYYLPLIQRSCSGASIIPVDEPTTEICLTTQPAGDPAKTPDPIPTLVSVPPING